MTKKEALEKIKELEEFIKGSEYIEGAYYKCWVSVNDISLIRQYRNGSMYDGNNEGLEPHGYAKVEPFETTPKLGLWVARDEDNDLYVYFDKPEREPLTGEWEWGSSGQFKIDKKIFPDLTWDDEPMEI